MRKYEKPSMRTSSMELEHPLLGGSMIPINEVSIESVGQEIGAEYDFSSSSSQFNHEWEIEN